MRSPGHLRLCIIYGIWIYEWIWRDVRTVTDLRVSWEKPVLKFDHFIVETMHTTAKQTNKQISKQKTNRELRQNSQNMLLQVRRHYISDVENKIQPKGFITKPAVEKTKVLKH